jgi:hypothetical protein
MHLNKNLCTLLVLLLSVPAAQSAVVTLNLNHLFSGVAPAGPNPWLTMKLEDGLAANTVRLTFDAKNLVGQEFVSGWYVNLNPALNPQQLSFAIVPPNPTQLTLNTITTGVNAYQANGNGRYDVLFDFPPPPGAFSAKFTSGEKVIVDVSRAGGLTVSDFLYESATGGGNGVHYAAAHVQGIGNDSGWIGATAIPEPSTYAAILGGAVLLGVIARRRFGTSGV